MTIFSRARDIVAANVADILDKAEDPAKMIRMMILEMEETLVEVRASAARVIADQKEMRRQVTRLDKLQESWVEKAELALSKGREDLAKGALVEKQKVAGMADGLSAEIELLDDALRASEADIAKLQGKMREARTRQNAIQSRLESANQRMRMREVYAGPQVDEAFSRFAISSAMPISPKAAPTRWPSAPRPRASRKRLRSFATRKRSRPRSRP